VICNNSILITLDVMSPKSECMRFVHSRGDFDSLLCSAIIVSAPSAGRPVDNPHGALCKTTLDARLSGRENSQGPSSHIAEGHLGDDPMHVPAPHCHGARVHAAETPR
jgi:hypothetical protein